MYVNVIHTYIRPPVVSYISHESLMSTVCVSCADFFFLSPAFPLLSWSFFFFQKRRLFRYVCMRLPIPI